MLLKKNIRINRQRKTLYFPCLLLLSFILLFPVFCFAQTQQLASVKFRSIEANRENIKNYPFLQGIADKHEKLKEKFDTSPNIQLASIDINKQNIVVVTFTGLPSHLYCGTLGCPHRFFLKTEGRFIEIGNIVTYKVHKATCNTHDYLVFAGGASAGINQSLASIWAVEQTKLTRLKKTSELKSDIVCQTALQKIKN